MNKGDRSIYELGAYHSEFFSVLSILFFYCLPILFRECFLRENVQLNPTNSYLYMNEHFVYTVG